MLRCADEPARDQKSRHNDRIGFRRMGLVMKIIKSYSTSVDAEVARIALDAAGVPSTVVGIDAAMEGGTAGVQLLVPDEWVDDALKVLERS
jgi:putative signal transducing protein